MTNKLPEKLTALRKQFHFAQADVAEKVGVSVNEYMNWENGNKICDITQLVRLAKLYKIPVVDLLDNTKVVTLPDPEILYQSVEIPFMDSEKEDISYTNAIALDEAEAQRIIEQTQSVPKYEETTESMGETRILDANEIQKTTANKVVKPQPSKKAEPKKANGIPKKPLFIGVGVVIALLLLSVLIGLFRNGGDNGGSVRLNLTDTNRFALGEQFSVYLDNNGSLVTSGNTPDLSAFQNVVQVSAGNSHLVGLKKDGSVVCAGSGVACGVEDWKDVTMVAAGNNHTVGLKQDGTVMCTGGAVACSVNSWEDIAAVYAGGDFTIGQTKDGSLKVAGNINAASKVQNVKNAKSIAMSDQEIVVIDKDGNVSSYSTGTGSSSNTSSWKNMRMAAIGNQFVAGLDQDGKVSIVTNKDDLAKEVATWTGIRYIAARGNTLVGVNANYKIIGVGDNSYNQYGIDETQVNPSATADVKLGAINNVNFNSTTAGLTITWDEVKDTDYYEVKISTTPEMVMNSVRNSVSVGSERLTDGTTYTVSITPCSRDLTKYQNGDTKTATHQYKAAQVKLNAPQNVSVTPDGTQIKVSWSGVENAEFYHVTIETMTQQANETNFTIDGSHMEDGKEYTVFVTAMSSNTRYSESDAGTAKFTYKAPVLKTPLKKPDILSNATDAQGNWTFTFATDENAQSYNVFVNDKTFTIDKGEITIAPGEANLVSGTEYLVRITAIPKDAEKNLESNNGADGTGERLTYTVKEPEPTPTPEEKEEEKKDG
ncbi:MAG: helix-turn-helix domain-containing protein [Solobacterium sp.]|nr:helix-turn-helix domain-containing protein [Solobacterium sp.]